MFEKMVMKISCKRLMNYLVNELGYEEKRAKRTISALRKVEPSILEAFLRWFYTGNFPKESLYGINVKALCDKRSLDAVTAFLTVDWAARDPQAAKSALSKGHDTLVFCEGDKERFQVIMDSNGWKLDNKEREIEEDTSDLLLIEQETQENERDLPTEGKAVDDSTIHVEDAD